MNGAKRESENGQTLFGGAKRRKTLSCSLCRQSKVRCDRQRPICSRCQARNLPASACIMGRTSPPTSPALPASTPPHAVPSVLLPPSPSVVPATVLPSVGATTSRLPSATRVKSPNLTTPATSLGGSEPPACDSLSPPADAPPPLLRTQFPPPPLEARYDWKLSHAEKRLLETCRAVIPPHLVQIQALFGAYASYCADWPFYSHSALNEEARVSWTAYSHEILALAFLGLFPVKAHHPDLATIMSNLGLMMVACASACETVPPLQLISWGIINRTSDVHSYSSSLFDKSVKLFDASISSISAEGTKPPRLWPKESTRAILRSGLGLLLSPHCIAAPSSGRRLLDTCLCASRDIRLHLSQVADDHDIWKGLVVADWMVYAPLTGWASIAPSPLRGWARTVSVAEWSRKVGQADLYHASSRSGREGIGKTQVQGMDKGMQAILDELAGGHPLLQVRLMSLMITALYMPYAMSGVATEREWALDRTRSIVPRLLALPSARRIWWGQHALYTAGLLSIHELILPIAMGERTNPNNQQEGQPSMSLRPGSVPAASRDSMLYPSQSSPEGVLDCIVASLERTGRRTNGLVPHPSPGYMERFPSPEIQAHAFSPERLEDLLIVCMARERAKPGQGLAIITEHLRATCTDLVAGHQPHEVDPDEALGQLREHHLLAWEQVFPLLTDCAEAGPSI